MEVHHHGHVHHEKKWKSYLFQFFMLFLAVFLGFLAEYFLEHTMEKKREKQYIKLLVEDLQTDTAVLHHDIPRMQESIRGLDTLINQTYLFLEGKGDTRLMYYTYHHYCRNRINIELHERGMNQLKNSGNMRLIHDRLTTILLANIESGFQALQERTQFYNNRQDDAASFGLRIFDFDEYRKANQQPDGSTNAAEDGFLSLPYQPRLNVTDPVYLREFAARVGYYRNTFNEYLNNFVRAMPNVENSIRIIARDYHIDLEDHYIVR